MASAALAATARSRVGGSSMRFVGRGNEMSGRESCRLRGCWSDVFFKFKCSTLFSKSGNTNEPLSGPDYNQTTRTSTPPETITKLQLQRTFIIVVRGQQHLWRQSHTLQAPGSTGGHAVYLMCMNRTVALPLSARARRLVKVPICRRRTRQNSPHSRSYNQGVVS